MAERLFNLPETKGEIKLRGMVTGTQKDNFLTMKTTKKGNPMNFLKFGLEVGKDSTVYLDLNGSERKEVFFYKKSETKGQKGVTKRIPWNNRKTFKEDGFNLIGMTVGLEKVIDENGKEKNDLKTLTEYDACEYISNNLIDGDSLFVLGSIDFGSYKNKNDEIKRSVKFVPNKILGAKEIDFEAEDFEQVADFQQTIVFMGITLDDSDKEDVKGVVEAKIIKYSTIEDAEFIIRDKKLYNVFKKNLKPYTAIKVWGNINNRVDSDDVEEDNGWGERNSFEKHTKTFIRELVITGADPSTIDSDTYSREEVDNALELIANSKKASSEFGDNDDISSDWGNKPSSKDEDDEIEGWD